MERKKTESDKVGSFDELLELNPADVKNVHVVTKEEAALQKAKPASDKVQ